MKNTRFNLEKKDIIFLSLLITLIVFSTYVWTNYHQKVERTWYYVQIPFIKRTVHCSDQAPDFMYTLMHETISKQKSMSNQLAFLSPDGVFHHCESGWEDGFKGDKLITVDSRFRYASVSKVVTSAMILDLVNQNKISLEQKLVDIIDLPKLKDERIREITVAMLLQHSAGFDRMKTYTPMLTMGKKPWCPTNIEYLAQETLDFEPNTQYQYSNVGYCLLGAIVEKVSNTSFRQAVEQRYHIAQRNIRFVDNDFLLEEIDYDYRNENFYGRFWRTQFDFKDSLSAVGGLSGSAKAITLLAKDMLKEKPLNILSRAEMPCAINLSEGCYGYAMEPFQKKGSNFTIYNKSGYFPGVESDIFVDDQGGVLTILRGATTPNRESLAEFRKNIYEHLDSFYTSK